MAAQDVLRLIDGVGRRPAPVPFHGGDLGDALPAVVADGHDHHVADVQSSVIGKVMIEAIVVREAHGAEGVYGHVRIRQRIGRGAPGGLLAFFLLAFFLLALFRGFTRGP